jgi:hypothetical protein
MGNGTGDFIYLLAAPAYLWVLIYGLRTFKEWPNIMARRNEARRDKAAIEGGQVERMDTRMRRLEERYEVLETAHQDCLDNFSAERDARAEERAGRLKAEALLLARQQSDQGAQLIVSSEREADAAKRNKP